MTSIKTIRQRNTEALTATASERGRLFVRVCAVILAAIQAWGEHELFHRMNWLQWSDQGHYMDSVRAWASFDFNPALHHYPPGYALMGVPFLWLMPHHPFLIPDIACSVASLFVFVKLCQRMSPGSVYVTEVACFAFLLSTCGGQTLLAIWVEPWTTTAECPLLLLMLLLTLNCGCWRRPFHFPNDGLLLGFVAGLAASIRPSDAALILTVSVFFITVRFLSGGSGLMAVFLTASSTLLGLIAGLIPFAVAHYVIFGLGSSDYLGHSASLGFEWRLIPIRWVMLVVSPRPLLPEGTGMEAVFFWILPGIAGLLLCTLCRGDDIAANALISVSILLYWLLYLSYRDLHPYGLWRFNNVHYFKWTLPFLAFWSYRFAVRLVCRSSRREAVIAVSATTLLFAWRPEFTPSKSGVDTAQAGNTITIPESFQAIDSAIMIQAFGSWRSLYFTQPGSLRINDQPWPGVGDVKFFPGPGGGLLVPLRQLPGGPITVTLPPPSGFPAGAAWQFGRQSLVFGLPCLLMPRLGECMPNNGLAWQWLRGKHAS